MKNTFMKNMRRGGGTLLKLSVLLLFVCLFGQAHAQNLDKFHALFISKFIDYIEWPVDKSDLKIGVMGNSGVYDELKVVVEQRGKAELKKISSASEAADCHMVFLPSSENGSFNEINSKTNGKNVLLVTEDGKFISKGAGISFYTEGGKLKFSISQSTVSNQNLKVSSSLLKLAKLAN